MTINTPTPQFTLLHRTRVLVNTDPQRRCYDGVHFSSELRWTPWATLGIYSADKIQDKLKFWRELNDYAISQRGESARSEYKAEPLV